MKHWVLDCNHGCPYIQPPPVRDKWHDIGAIDAVKAILITNE